MEPDDNARKELHELLLEKTNKQRSLFFEAWKEGVCLAGPEFFGPRDPETATEKNHLRPKIHVIEGALGVLSPAEGKFLSAMVSFYNPELGERIATLLNIEKSVCGLTLGIDGKGRRIIAKLLIRYCGW